MTDFVDRFFEIFFGRFFDRFLWQIFMTDFWKIFWQIFWTDFSTNFLTDCLKDFLTDFWQIFMTDFLTDFLADFLADFYDKFFDWFFGQGNLPKRLRTTGLKNAILLWCYIRSSVIPFETTEILTSLSNFSDPFATSSSVQIQWFLTFLTNYPFWWVWKPNYSQNCQKICLKNL